MGWVKENIKELAIVIPILGSGLGYGGNMSYKMIFDNGYNKGTIDTSREYQPKLDTANAKLNHISGRAAEWKLQLDDC